ncbi:MAG TPA: hypothetical protein HPP77_01235 [Candidatus Hydrogenedentes bacterium]|nr:hypothetical protein [Candidatus Hydrogenedentota bacterium]
MLGFLVGALAVSMAAGLSPGGAAAAVFPMDGLILWLDAADGDTLDTDDGAVCAWRNKAPGRGNALSSAAEQRPQFVEGAGGIPAVRFDGVDDVLRDVEFGRTAKMWTLAVVAAPASNRTDRGGICAARSGAGHDYDPGFTVDLYGAREHFDQLSIEGAGRLGFAWDQKQRIHAYGTALVVVVERDDTEIRLFVNGVAEDSRAVAPATTVMDELRVGARHYGGVERHYFDGDIAAVLLYDRVLTKRERRMVEKYLGVSGKVRRKERSRPVSDTPDAEAQRTVFPPKLVEAWPSVEAYLDATERDRARLEALPIRTDVREAVALGVRHLTSLFDANRDDEPFFYSNRRVDGTGVMHHAIDIGIPHVVGRCLLGCMMAEEATDLQFPSEGLAILERYCRVSFDNPDHLNSFIDPRRGNNRFIQFHNIREGLYGLAMLIRGRDSAWARETAGGALRTLDGLTDDAGFWSSDLAAGMGMADRAEGMCAANAARTVDPLLELYRLTSDPTALKLAGLYARQGLAIVFTPDGRFAPAALSSGHVHSITSSLSGITEYALLVKDAEMVDACRRIMERGVPEYHSSWGWGDEVMPDHPANLEGRGEINQTGDVVRTALHLGRAGYPRYYELAERYVRSMLLPTQHRKDELERLLKRNENPKDDSERNVLERTVGGYSMQLPNDRMREGDWPLATLDITSGAVHALSECWMHQVLVDETTIEVNLLFDRDHREITIESGLPVDGRLEITAKSSKNVRVRIPEWVDPDTLELSVRNRSRKARIKSGHVKITGLRPGDGAVLAFDVPCKVERETVDGTTYTTTWIGNQIIDIRPRGNESPLPF